MSTTIQIDERTLRLLKKIKEDAHAASYDEAINKLVAQKTATKTMAGFLGKKPLKDILKGLREKHERV